MSAPFSNELLSAYLDGELPASEAETLELQLAQRPELREELEELRQVSARVRQLPRTSAPQDFATGVLTAIKQRQPATEVAAPPVTLGAVLLSWPHWRRRLMLMATCVLAAGGIWLFQPPTPEEQTTTDSRIVPQDETSLAEGTLPVPAVLPGMVPALSMTEGVAESTVAIDGEFQLFLEKLLRDGRGLTAGELLTYLETVNGEPVVVEYTVADVSATLGEIQLLLSQNGIRSLTTGQPKDAQASTNGLQAFYIEADESQLAAVMDGIQQLPNFVSLTIPNEGLEGLTTVDVAQDDYQTSPEAAMDSPAQSPLPAPLPTASTPQLPQPAVKAMNAPGPPPSASAIADLPPALAPLGVQELPGVAEKKQVQEAAAIDSIRLRPEGSPIGQLGDADSFQVTNSSGSGLQVPVNNPEELRGSLRSRQQVKVQEQPVSGNLNGGLAARRSGFGADLEADRVNGRSLVNEPALGRSELPSNAPLGGQAVTDGNGPAIRRRIVLFVETQPAAETAPANASPTSPAEPAAK